MSETTEVQMPEWAQMLEEDAQYYVPSMVTFGIMSACFINVGTVLSIRRQTGLLGPTCRLTVPALSAGARQRYLMAQ